MKIIFNIKNNLQVSIYYTLYIVIDEYIDGEDINYKTQFYQVKRMSIAI